MGNLASLLFSRKNYKEAERFYDLSYQGRQTTLGKEHPDTLMTASNLAMCFQQRGKLDEAEIVMKLALSMPRSYGNSHIHTLTSITNYAVVLWQKGELVEAEGLLEDALEGLRAEVGKDNPYTLKAVSNLGTLLVEANRFEEAERHFA